MELKGKKVLVVGLGKSGRAAALFLRRKGAQVTVSDTRSAEALGKDIPALLEEGIAVEAGGHGLLTFRRQDLIVVSPGVPIDTPELVQVKAFGLPIIGEVELAAQYLKGKTLAITGSNGKTTTTSLCGAILEAGKLPVSGMYASNVMPSKRYSPWVVPTHKKPSSVCASELTTPLSPSLAVQAEWYICAIGPESSAPNTGIAGVRSAAAHAIHRTVRSNHALPLMVASPPRCPYLRTKMHSKPADHGSG